MPLPINNPIFFLSATCLFTCIDCFNLFIVFYTPFLYSISTSINIIFNEIIGCYIQILRAAKFSFFILFVWLLHTKCLFLSLYYLCQYFLMLFCYINIIIFMFWWILRCCFIFYAEVYLYLLHFANLLLAGHNFLKHPGL